MKTKLKLHFLILLAVLSMPTLAHAQGTAFNYQGRLVENGVAASGSYDFIFTIRDALTGGNVLSAPVPLNAVAVSAGQFAVPLDFGPGVFTGAPRWLEIAVHVSGGGAHTTLAPRQALLPTPYSIFAASAASAASVPLGTVAANQLNTVGPAPTAGQFLSYNGGSLAWTAPGVAAGNIWSLNGGFAYYNAGNVGVGTTTPATKLTVLTGPNAYGFEHTDGTIRMGTFLGGSAGGGWIGTRSNHKLSFYVNDGSSSMVVDTNGYVGMGTLSPKHRLSLAGGPSWTAQGWAGAAELGNGSALGWQANAAGQRFGMGHANTGFYLFRTASDPGTTAGAAIYDLVVNDAGSVGIGTSTPLAGTRLHVAGTTVLESGGNGGGFISFGAPNAETGLTINGTANNRADLRFDGSTLKLVATAVAGPPPAENGLAITTAGNVGIGIATLDPNIKLEVRSTNGFAVFGRSGFEGVHGESTHASAAAVAGFNLSTGPGVYGVSQGGGYGGFFVGKVRVGVLEIAGGADLAEPFPMKEEQIEKGSVVVIDDEHPGRLKRSTQAYDTRVAGIVSGANGVHPGISLKQEGTLDQGENVALTGRAYVQADASTGPIKPGDLLTTSATPGHAMKVADHAQAQGAILGKAMSGLNEGRGLVLVLVTLQ